LGVYLLFVLACAVLFVFLAQAQSASSIICASSTITTRSASSHYTTKNSSSISSPISSSNNGYNHFTPLFNDSALSWKEDLFQRLDRIRVICRTLCTNMETPETWKQNSVPIDGANLRLTIAQDVDCPAILNNQDVDVGDTSVPYPPPPELLKYYSMGGQGQVVMQHRYQNIYLGAKALSNIWDKENVDKLVAAFKAPQPDTQNVDKAFRPTYGDRTARKLRDKLQEAGLGNKSQVLVIGSEKPWVESICLAVGARHVTTLEYGQIDSQHAQIHTMTPDKMRQKYAAGILPKFDAVVTYSSVEHSGLGRYGDALNPWGDLLTIARAWCLTTDDALLVVNVPTWQEKIEFNAHRWYGPMRYSLLATNWVQIDGASHPNHPEVTIAETILAFRKVSDFTPYLDRLGQD